VPEKPSETGVVLGYRYQIIREIGKGLFSRVFLAKNQRDDLIALKIV